MGDQGTQEGDEHHRALAVCLESNGFPSSSRFLDPSLFSGFPRNAEIPPPDLGGAPRIPSSIRAWEAPSREAPAEEIEEDFDLFSEEAQE